MSTPQPTDGARPDTDALNDAHARLSTAVRDLLQPTTEAVSRADPDHPDVLATTTTAAADHAKRTRALQRAHAGYSSRRDPAGIRRTLAALIERERAFQAAATARRVGQAQLPSLLEQLVDAVHSTQGFGAGTAGVHRSPIGLDAAELLSNLGRTVSAPPGAGPDALARRIRSWAGLAGHWRTTEPTKLITAADAAHRWVRDARELLTPRRRMTLVGACPRCGNTTAHHRDDTGETVRRPALEVDVTTGWARCLAVPCDATWSPDRLPFLGALLEEQAQQPTQQDDPDSPTIDDQQPTA